MKTIALVVFIVFEIVVLITADIFRRSMPLAIAVGLFAVIAMLLVVTSDFFLDYQERRRERGGRTEL